MLRDSAPKASEVDYDVVAVEAPAHPMNRVLLSYWQSKMGTDGIVRRSAIDPFDVRQALGGMFIVEPVDGGCDLLYRLVGSANELRLGLKCTGRRFTECYGPRMAADQIAFHSQVFAAGKPAFLRGRLMGLDVEHADFEACYLPMKTDDGRDQIMGGLFDMAE